MKNNVQKNNYDIPQSNYCVKISMFKVLKLSIRMVLLNAKANCPHIHEGMYKTKLLKFWKNHFYLFNFLFQIQPRDGRTLVNRVKHLCYLGVKVVVGCRGEGWGGDWNVKGLRKFKMKGRTKDNTPVQFVFFFLVYVNS